MGVVSNDNDVRIALLGWLTFFKFKFKALMFCFLMSDYITLAVLHTFEKYPSLDISLFRAMMLIWRVYRIWGNRSYKGNNQLKCNACACLEVLKSPTAF